MSTAQASRDFDAPLDVAERLWLDVRRWRAFVDGFERLVSQEGDWPDQGAEVVWESTPAGRGQVAERVISRRPGVELETAVEDPQIVGVQRVAFAELGDGGTAIDIELEYQLRRAGPLSALTDALFIRRAVRDSLRRTLRDFDYELRSEVAGEV